MIKQSIKICLCLCFFLIFSAVPVYALEISVGVDIILASQGSPYVDSRISGIHGQLQNLFNFSSYELYGSQKLAVAMDSESRVMLPEGKEFLLTPLYLQGNMVVMQAKILSNGRLIVDTQFRVSQGGYFFVGGPKTNNGVIILKVTAY